MRLPFTIHEMFNEAITTSWMTTPHPHPSRICSSPSHQATRPPWLKDHPVHQVRKKVLAVCSSDAAGQGVDTYSLLTLFLHSRLFQGCLTTTLSSTRDEIDGIHPISCNVSTFDTTTVRDIQVFLCHLAVTSNLHILDTLLSKVINYISRHLINSYLVLLSFL